MAKPADDAADRPVDAQTRARREALAHRAREYHDALSAAIESLERALAAAAAGRSQPWLDRVATELALVREAIADHVGDVEQSEGLFDAIVEHAPRHTRRVAALRDEHASLVSRTSALAARLGEGEGVDFGSLRRAAAALLASLRAHRADEADLIYEAFWTDIGAVD